MIATAAVAAALTVTVSLVPSALAFRAPEGHVAIETAASLVALLIGFIVLGRFRQSARLVDLLLAAAMGVIGMANFAFAVVPSLTGNPFAKWAIWAAAAGRVAGAILFCAAAFVPDRQVPRRQATAL